MVASQNFGTNTVLRGEVHAQPVGASKKLLDMEFLSERCKVHYGLSSLRVWFASIPPNDVSQQLATFLADLRLSHPVAETKNDRLVQKCFKRNQVIQEELVGLGKTLLQRPPERIVVALRWRFLCHFVDSAWRLHYVKHWLGHGAPPRAFRTMTHRVETGFSYPWTSLKDPRVALTPRVFPKERLSIQKLTCRDPSRIQLVDIQREWGRRFFTKLKQLLPGLRVRSHPTTGEGGPHFLATRIRKRSPRPRFFATKARKRGPRPRPAL